jgi:soluble lytic murein transglycosylase
LLLCFVSSCSSQASSPKIAEAQAVSLPDALATGTLQFKTIIALRETLNQQQQILALRKFLGQWGIADKEKQEASYLLGKLLQSATSKPDLEEALKSFQIAQDLPALKQLSRWHGIDVAVALGQEKAVRHFLNKITPESENKEELARASYALAQSYLRANETDAARETLEKIRKDYPQSVFAIGALYYLAEMDWTNATKPQSPTDDSNPKAHTLNDASTVVINPGALKTSLGQFAQYLELSPAGHFAQNAVARLESAQKLGLAPLTESELDGLAQAYYAASRWDGALAIWNKTKPNKRLSEIANCLAHTHQVPAARAALLQATKANQNLDKVFGVARYLCDSLSKEEATKFWHELLSALTSRKDTALWNIAVRTPPPACLQYFKELIKDYPSSSFAAESHWWLFWYDVQHKSGKDAAALVTLGENLSAKYDSSKAAPRFLFWSAKIAQGLGNDVKALAIYKKIARAYSSDYYAFRAQEKLALLEKRAQPFSWSQKYRGRLPLPWELPQPLQLGDHSSQRLAESAKELISLKELEESLQFLTKEDAEVKSWVLAHIGRPVQSIATATKHLPGTPITEPLWQYAYPLYYANEVQSNCTSVSNVDPVLMHALVREESHYEPKALSASKAIGLTQVMPGTAYGVAKLLNIPIKNTDQFYDPDLNLKLGTQYFSTALSRFQNNALYAVASYNGGANAVRGWIASNHSGDPDTFVENIPYRETRDYVRKVFGSYWNYIRVYGNTR